MSNIDRPLLFTILTLVVVGFFIFTSASLGLLARDGASFSSVAFNQIVFGIIFGIAVLFITTKIKYTFWRKYALHIFLISIALTLLVFIPGIGAEFGGAKRWILLGPFSFQPAELLKFGFIIYFAAWLSNTRDRIHTLLYGILPFFIFLAGIGLILLAQPDTGTFFIIALAGFAMFIAAGARGKDLLILFIAALIALAVLAYLRPYIMDRLLTFMNPARDPLGAGYQIQQSLIAIGSGEVVGRGFGQSIQKFNFLPEPISDSIFAVAAEEFGFVGSVVLISLFLVFAFRGFRIAIRAPDYFSGLVTTGIVILIIAQSFTNIASMVGVFPLTGLPLLFVSHGGTALLLALAEVGIVLNISKYSKK